jgi:hypothetical protein
MVASMYNAYGRGAEIWPESQDDAVQLSDSFPNGEVPFSAIIAIEKQDMDSLHQRVETSIHVSNDNDNDVDVASIPTTSDMKVSSSGVKRRLRLPAKKRLYLRRILRRAAAKEELDIEGELSPIDKTPIVIAFSLVVRGWVRPMDLTLVACCTTYFILLNMAGKASRDLSGAPILPATPPQGHVPTLVSNPLGWRMEQSSLYNTWLKTGVLLGLVGPIALLFRSITTVNGPMETIRIVARPLFLLCCQIVTEAISRRLLVSLYSVSVSVREIDELLQFRAFEGRYLM